MASLQPPPGEGERLPLREVAALFIGIGDKQRLEATSLLEAFGGRGADTVEAATHAIVPDASSLTKSGWNELRQQIRLCCKQRRGVSTVKWLQEVIETGVDPWNFDVLFKHAPPFVREMATEVLGSRPSSKSHRSDGQPTWEQTEWQHRLRPRSGRQTCAAPAAAPAAPIAPSAASEAAASKRRRTGKGPEWDERASRQQHLMGSLAETHEFLSQERPEEVEEAQLRLALQRSLLDCALQPLPAGGRLPAGVGTGGGGAAGGAGAGARGAAGSSASEHQAPEDVLGVRPGALPAEVRAAFREKALASHPDKGGDPQVFCRVKQAYLALVARARAGQPGAEAQAASRSDEGAPLALPGATCSQDFELRDHRALVKAAFEQDGVDLAAAVARQNAALTSLGLEACECGSVVTTARGRTIRNQCFYLSLARSYLGSGGSKQDVATTALDLKRVVETAVLEAHPDWGGARVGENVQAFSDFLFFVLGSHPLLSEWSVAVFDATSGGVEIYIGSDFPGPEREEEQRSNLLTVLFVPGHYQALVPASKGRVAATPRPNLSELQLCLEGHGVTHVPTNL